MSRPIHEDIKYEDRTIERTGSRDAEGLEKPPQPMVTSVPVGGLEMSAEEYKLVSSAIVNCVRD